MTALLVIRHGKTVWNLEKKIQGRRNIPLCDEGRAQLRQFSLPAEFSHFNWVSSPLIRARETAELLDGVKIAVEERLIEMDWGAWEGYTIRDLRSGFGAAMAQNEAKGLHMTPDGGESPADVQARLLPWLRSLTVPTIAVTHKGV
ncbi:MAG: histidine phosphatase family protein, partial [Sneathiella sp.]